MRDNMCSQIQNVKELMLKNSQGKNIIFKKKVIEMTPEGKFALQP